MESINESINQMCYTFLKFFGTLVMSLLITVVVTMGGVLEFESYSNVGWVFFALWMVVCVSFSGYVSTLDEE